MITEIKAYRTEIDRIAQFAQSINEGNLSREAQNAYDSLRMAKCWLGIALGYLGDKYPYEPIAGSTDDNVTKVVVPAETAEIPEHEWDQWHAEGPLMQIAGLRAGIKSLKHTMQVLIRGRPLDGLAQCHQHLTEAHFWLGMDLLNHQPDKA